MPERHKRLCAMRDQLVPVLTSLDACEEHHVAAIISMAITTLETRIAAGQPPGGALGMAG